MKFDRDDSGCIADWIQGYTSIPLVAEVFMFLISFYSLIMEPILWNGRLHRFPDLLV